MKSIITTVLIILLSFGACLYFPWWSIAIVAFIVSALIPQSPWASFFSGFIALFLLWGFMSLWISVNNDHILANRVSLLIFKIESAFLLILATALIGGLVAGFGALTASFIRPVKTRINGQLK
ncbi:MAG: hypothetical protein M3Z26_13450 [Bacteroidota bacterium]|nr:hypothetical protein [Bacteroidota bacterium]